MSHTPVSISNLALGHLSAKNTIQSFNEQSVEARTAKLFYDVSRKSVLEAYDWGFARKQTALALHPDAPPPGWAYRYVYPADCIKVRSIITPEIMSMPDYYEQPWYDAADSTPYRIILSNDGREKTIVTNMEDACVYYTFNQENENLFDENFVLAFSYHLANLMCMKLTGNLDIKDTVLAEMRRYMPMASAVSMNEGVQPQPRDSEQIRGR